MNIRVMFLSVWDLCVLVVVFGFLCLFIENGIIFGGVVVYLIYLFFLRYVYVFCFIFFVY